MTNLGLLTLIEDTLKKLPDRKFDLLDWGNDAEFDEAEWRNAQYE